MKSHRSQLAILAVLITVVALALPALASAARPNAAWFSANEGADGSLKFHVQIGQGNVPTIDRAELKPADNPEFKPQSEFERVNVKGDGRFETCTWERVTDVFDREYCISGQFDAPDHAAGMVKIYISADRERWPKPLDTFRWSADQLRP